MYVAVLARRLSLVGSIEVLVFIARGSGMSLEMEVGGLQSVQRVKGTGLDQILDHGTEKRAFSKRDPYGSYGEVLW
jgi:hypothetical protein